MVCWVATLCQRLFVVDHVSFVLYSIYNLFMDR